MTPTFPAMVGLGARALIGAAVRLARRRRSRAPAAPPVPVSSRPVRPAPVSAPVVEPFSPAEQLPPTPPRPGWAVLNAGQPLRELAGAVPLPCCALVALWAREVAGAEPRPVASAHKTYAAALAADRQWWADANVWDAKRPWSAPAAVQAMLGGEIVGPLVVGTDGPAPHLTPGRWHVVQRWHAGTGHTYLAHCDADGLAVIVQSSERLGFRVSRPAAWAGDAGLTGISVAVLTLPEGV